MVKIHFKEEQIITPEVKLQNLNPPKKINTSGVKINIQEKDLNDEFYEKIAKSSEFRRLLYLLLFGKTHRGSLEKLDKDINNVITQVNIASDVAKIIRGSRIDYKKCMNELKEVLEARKKEIEKISGPTQKKL